MKTRRVQREIRREQILNAAIDLARTVGYTQIRRDAVAERAGCSTGLVSLYYSTMVQLQRAVMRAAVHRPDLVVLAQGLAANDSHARNAPSDVKRAAAELLV